MVQLSCNVPKCNGNRSGGPHVRTFQMPKDETRKQEWLKAIFGDNPVVGKSTRVCELHFKDSEIIRGLRFFDGETMRSLPNKVLKLSDKAIPSIFPGSAEYSSAIELGAKEREYARNFVKAQDGKVCEKHFLPQDIITHGFVVDSKTGRMIVCPLSRKKLTPTAVPCVFNKAHPAKTKANYKKKRAQSESDDDDDNAEEFCCSVPNCWERSNLNLSTYAFPTHPDLRQKWLSVFPLPNYKPQKTSSICQKHFKPTDFAVSKKGEITEMLKPMAVPSIFPILTSLPEPEEPKEEIEDDFFNNEPMDRDPLSDASDEVVLAHKIPEKRKKIDEPPSSEMMEDFYDLVKLLKEHGLPTSWYYIVDDDAVFVYSLTLNPQPSVKYSLRINSNLAVKAFVKTVPITDTHFYKIPGRLTTYKNILDILNKFPTMEQNFADTRAHDEAIVQEIGNMAENLKTDQNKSVIAFVMEQLKMCILERNKVKFSDDIIVFTNMIYAICGKALNYIKNSGYLILPNTNQ